MNFIYDVLGSNFLIKIFLVPAMLGGIFYVKILFVNLSSLKISMLHFYYILVILHFGFFS